MRRRWRSSCRTLALGALALFGPLSLGTAHAADALLRTAPPATIALGDEEPGDDGGEDPPGATDRVVKIGPQAVVIVDEVGNVRMWEADPSQQAPACRSALACWGGALLIFAGFAIATYEDVTTNTEGAIGDR
jgi:hypothetical protein